MFGSHATTTTASGIDISRDRGTSAECLESYQHPTGSLTENTNRRNPVADSDSSILNQSMDDENATFKDPAKPISIVDVPIGSGISSFLRNGASSPCKMTDSNSNPCTPTSSNEARRAARREQRRDKDRFLVFTRVLVKYLEQTDEALHYEVREVIRDCTERKSRNEPGYESVTTVLKRRIQEIVDEDTWNRAEMYLDRFMKEKSVIRSSSFQFSRRGSMSSQQSRRGSMSSQQSRRGSMSSRYTVETAETEDSTCSMTSSLHFRSEHHPSSSMYDPSGRFVSYHSASTYGAGMGFAGLAQQRRASAHAGSVGPIHTDADAQEKEQFVLLMRNLMKILDQKDPEGLCKHVQVIVQDCIERNQMNEPEYESITSVVRERLEVIVPPEFWDEANQMLQEQQEQTQQDRFIGGWRTCRRSSI